MRASVSIITFFLLLSFSSTNTFAKIEGFYKDVFQDQGTQISGGDLDIDCEYIDYSMEHLNTSDNTTKQTAIMVKNPDDDNGYLLYPDGEPRFAIIFYHGGYMDHAKDLEEEGREIIRTHYYNGGSQFGSCAGSYMLSSSQDHYFKIWPGRMNGENVSNTSVDKIINEGSPFIGYMGYKAGDEIEGVYHNNGSSIDTTEMYEGTQICAMHTSSDLDGYGAIWTWKDNDTTGQVLGHTGHPEGSSNEERIKYICASMLLITDGLGVPDIKHQLENGKTIVMDKVWADNDPLFTKIGDKQYHHFTIDLENPAKNVKITLDGEDDYDFHLFAAQDTFAFNYAAQHLDSSSGADKELTIEMVESGTLYIGVKLATTVTSNQEKFNRDLFIEYSGELEVLNGIEYSITATWDVTDIFALNQKAKRDQLVTKFNGRTLVISVGKLQPQQLQVFDARGRMCWNTKPSKSVEHYSWQPQSAGMYFIRVKSGEDILTRKITITK